MTFSTPTPPAPDAMGRLGKIARLFQRLREEVNLRLDDREPGPHLLAWLNGLPEVQALQQLPGFGQAPINAQNLTNWRQGGFAHWQRHRQGLEFARTLAAESAGVESPAGEAPIADRLAVSMMIALVVALRGAEALPDGPKKGQIVLAAVREITLLRRCHQTGRRLCLPPRARAAEAADQTKSSAIKPDKGLSR
jgi:hypothetical protein